MLIITSKMVEQKNLAGAIIVFFQLELDWITQIGKKMESGTPTILVGADIQ